MGIIDTIISKIKKAFRKEVNRSVDNTIDRSVNNAFRNATQPNNTNNYSNQQYSGTRQAKNPSVRTTIDSLIATYTQAGYTVERNKPFSQVIDSTENARNYDYVFYLNGELRGCVMITDHNRDRNRPYLTAKYACTTNGIPFVNFFTHFPNDPNYVAQRLSANIPV